MTRYFRTTLFAAATALAFAAPALAGPPLLCHPYDIGNAKSLPWVGEKSWSEGQPDYKLENLVRDTEALLTPSTPVIVRMTLAPIDAKWVAIPRPIPEVEPVTRAILSMSDAIVEATDIRLNRCTSTTTATNIQQE